MAPGLWQVWPPLSQLKVVVRLRDKDTKEVAIDDGVAGNPAARGKRDDGKQNGAKRRGDSGCSVHDAGTLANIP